ncbi:toprim domain-containing protein [Acidiphilium sp. AL]|uniref:Toprim domain-containing protein n=1 Tax=Acidiphilium iwatense TaxID=768198 RepID=A0ABS9E2I6_9PROT|nr:MULTISPECIES: toprim domain-containing protein [Acidiphilium]MCF3947804.1 toprim domain-containing protein [Acidiphilium iwatense]MCU4161625.1 toprim domain-containing protein [Acidiphilium sp. AL]
MSMSASELARRLARNAETVCRYYLSNGHREGRYWLVGDVANTPGRSLFVRLTGPERGKGAAGNWTDGSTSQHGDLLDLIALNRGLDRFRDVLDEARSFLSLPRDNPADRPFGHVPSPVARGSADAARRLFAMAQPIAGTIAETYLRRRGITAFHGIDAVRFHPSCYYRPHAEAPAEIWPALIAAVTDLDGKLTGAHRTWLDPTGFGKAPVVTPRRAMGHLLGHGVRFGIADDVMAAGEGIETMLSLRCVLPKLPMVACLSANHLAALVLPSTVRRLYIARDNDKAGRHAAIRLRDRARSAGIEVRILWPVTNDFNADLRRFGADALRARLWAQLAPEDAARFASVDSGTGPSA